jgi:hypothetical protein
LIIYPNSSVCTNAKLPAFITATGAGGRKMRGGVLGLALIGLSLRFVGIRHHAAAIATGCSTVIGTVSAIEGV